MLDIAAELDRWCREGRAFALATVVSAGGSAPRQPGAALAVDAAGTAVGGVSGGCVEGAVYELCRRSLERGTVQRERFGYGDAEGLAIGLTCGGTIEVLVTPYPAESSCARVLAAAAAGAAAGRAGAFVLATGGPAGLPGRALYVPADAPHLGTLGGPPELDREAAAQARAELAAGRTGPVTVGAGGAAGSRCGEPVTLLVESSLPPPRMLVFGAVDFAAALTRAGRFLGHRVTVCDARPVFATADRFPEADEVRVAWPHRYLDEQWAAGLLDRRTAVCVLTHDTKFDIPLLLRALRLPLAYVGAMGSRRTHRDRMRRLREAGLGRPELARLRSPIGLDLGARTPEETAVSIAAEIVALRHGGTGRPLTTLTTPVHSPQPQPRPRSAAAAGR